MQSQEGDLLELLNGPKRKAGSAPTGSVFGDLLAAMIKNTRPHDEALEQMAANGKLWFGAHPSW